VQAAELNSYAALARIPIKRPEVKSKTNAMPKLFFIEEKS
jgi:hypothetical protein